MSKQIGAVRMRELAAILDKELNGLGFALIVFEFRKKGMLNYISNAQRADMIKALQETLRRFNDGQIFNTPEEN